MTNLLKPVLLLGSGRTGSTLAMSILATSKDMVFNKTYPFETRLLTYAAHLASVTIRPSKDIENWSHSKLNLSELDLVGPIPFPIDNYIDRKEFQSSFFDAIWGALSDQMRSAENNPNATFYAEKSPNFLREKMLQFTDVKSIQLIRDPRDILLSTKSFNAKRGTLRFGWLEEDDDKSYAFRLIKRYRRVLKDVLEDKKNELSLVVRYEDLIEKQAESIERMSDWVGTRFTAPPSSPNYLNRHTTSVNISKSVARWKTELDEDVVAMFKKEIPDLLDAFGYSV